MELRSYSVTNQISYNSISKLLCVSSNRIGYFMQMSAILRILDSLEEWLSGHIDKLPCLRAYIAYAVCSCGIGMISLVNNSCVKTHYISVLDYSLLGRNTMHNFLVNGYTYWCRISIIIKKWRDTAIMSYLLVSVPVYIIGTDSRLEKLFKVLMDSSKYSSSLTH